MGETITSGSGVSRFFRSGRLVPGWRLLDPARTEFARFRGTSSRLLPGRLLGAGRHGTATTLLFPTARLLVHRLPGALLCYFFGSTPLFITLFDVLGLTLLFVRIFAFGSSGHSPFVLHHPCPCRSHLAKLLARFALQKICRRSVQLAPCKIPLVFPTRGAKCKR